MTEATPETRTVILVADDDEFMLETIIQYLDNAGYETAAAEDGREALDIFQRKSPELVLLDANMPRIDGFQACRTIHEITADDPVPVIMVTAMEDERSVKKAFAAGATEYITKPINWGVLGQRIRLLIKQRRAERAAFWAHQSQRLINALLRAEDPALSLNEQLRHSLELILEINWLPLEGQGAIFLVEEADEQTLLLTVEKNLESSLLNACARVPLGTCLCGRVAASGEMIFSDHLEERHEECTRKMSEHGHCCVPIGTDETIIGVLNLYVRAGVPADDRIRETLITIGRTLANIIERKRMQDEIKDHRDKLAFERGFIEEIITRMRATKRYDPRHIRALQNPLEKTAGDLVVSAFRPDGAQQVLLGDFTGHGLPAAIGGPLVSNIFYSMTLNNIDVAEIMAEINQRLYEQTPAGMFMAAGFLELDASRRKLSVWNCSIPDILIYRHNRLQHRVRSGHFARGMIDRPEKPRTDIDVQPGDRVFAFTDGFIEETDANGEMFGQENFERLLVRMLDGNHSLEFLQQFFQEFRAGHEQSDDMTMIELTC